MSRLNMLTRKPENDQKEHPGYLQAVKWQDQAAMNVQKIFTGGK